MTWTEDCSWFEGGAFHVICTSQASSPMGPVKGIAIVGYNPDRKVYTHYGVDNNGWAGYSEGTKAGNTWTYLSDETVKGTTYHTRYSMTLVTPSTATFSWEASEDGTSWVLLMDGTTRKR